MRLNESELNIKDADDILSKQITSWDYYPTYSAYLTLMQQFALNYPDLCRIDTIGKRGRKAYIICYYFR